MHVKGPLQSRHSLSGWQRLLLSYYYNINEGPKDMCLTFMSWNTKKSPFIKAIYFYFKIFVGT